MVVVGGGGSGGFSLLFAFVLSVVVRTCFFCTASSLRSNLVAPGQTYWTRCKDHRS